MIQVKQKPNSIYTVIFSSVYKPELKFEGYVRSFSATNDVGMYDILPGHENFVTVVVGGAVVVDEEGKRLDFNLGRAVVEVSENVLKVFVEY